MGNFFLYRLTASITVKKSQTKNVPGGKRNFLLCFLSTTFVTFRIRSVTVCQSIALAESFPEHHCSTADSLWLPEKIKKCDAVKRAYAYRYQPQVTTLIIKLSFGSVGSDDPISSHDFYSIISNTRKGSCRGSEKNASTPTLY